jgi:SWIM zinc finger
MNSSHFALQQPLVTRPAYGQDQEQELVGESETPGAGGGAAPMLLNPGIPQVPRGPGEGPEQNEPARTKGLSSAPVAESGLPKGDPGGKGMSLSPDIPGEQTYKKPEDDIRDFDKGNKTDPWRRDSPDDQLKERNVVDDKEDWGLQHDQVGEMGKGKWDTTIKTKYPYRDGLPHQHYATSWDQAAFVAGMFLVARSHDLRVAPGNRLLVASKPDDVITGLNPQFAQRAKTCGVTLKRVDAGNLRWLFAVNCGNGPKVVKLKAFRSSNVVRLGKMDIDVACSCPAWQWLGPEHHAKSEDYLDGSPRGTASTPVIRDPQGINRVCKHVAAVLSYVQGWEVPAKPKKK